MRRFTPVIKMYKKVRSLSTTSSTTRTDIPTESFDPEEIVLALDKHIIGQQNAKRAVAIAFRNRFRRRQLPADVQKEITPANILMKGPTG